MTETAKLVNPISNQNGRFGCILESSRKLMNHKIMHVLYTGTEMRACNLSPFLGITRNSELVLKIQKIYNKKMTWRWRAAKVEPATYIVPTQALVQSWKQILAHISSSSCLFFSSCLKS